MARLRVNNACGTLDGDCRVPHPLGHVVFRYLAEKYRKAEYKGTPFTEDQWATHTTPKYGTYNYAKRVSEQEITKLWNGELVSILPSWVIGPQQNDQITSSQQVVSSLANHQYKMAPPLYFDLVDVRDVARAHVFAALNDEMKCGRYSASGNNCYSSSDIGKFLNKADPQLKAAEKALPWIVLWCVSWFDTRLSSFLLYEKTSPMQPIDNTKLKLARFKFEHTDVSATIKDCLASLRAHGVVKK